jgi:hypothetical protein
MSEIIAEEKQRRFEETLRQQEQRTDDHRIEREMARLTDLQISLEALNECPRYSQMALVNQRLYKVTLYFVVNLPSFKPSKDQPVFPWHFIYLELSLRAQD